MKAYRFALGLALTAGVYCAPAMVLGQVAETPVAAARRAVNEAHAAVNAAKMQMDQARLKVVAAFKVQHPEYATAETEATKAKAEIERSKSAALAAVRSKPEYTKAVEAKAAAQAQMRALQGKGSEAEMNALMETSLKNSQTVTAMEKSAIEADPKHNEAVVRLAEATRTLEGFKPQIDEACAMDPDYQTLVQAHQAAADALLAAQTAQKDAAIAAGQAAREAARARSEAARNKNK